MSRQELSDNLDETLLREGTLPPDPTSRLTGTVVQRNNAHLNNRKSERNTKIIDLYSDLGRMFGIDRSAVYRIIRSHKVQKLGPLVSNGGRKPEFGGNARASRMEVIHHSKKSGDIRDQKQKKLQDYHIESERNKIIIDLYYHHPEFTLLDIGRKFGISEPRIYAIVRTHELHRVCNRIG